MYEAYYGLSDKPFSMLPDPGYLYLSKKHETALTLLEYALMNNAGFCVVTGEPGAGKTTLLRKLLQAVGDDKSVGMITNTHKSFGELLDWVLSAFSIHEPDLNKVEKNQKFVDFLLEQYANNKSTLLIVDEAQNMMPETLEELRMLSNINSEKDQLLQIILAGQPQLKDTLRTPELMQFAQRIAVDYHLDSLNLEETCGYIQHRLTVAGAVKDVFTPKACERIYQYSGGTPRLINLICDTAMVYGFADQDETIDETIIDQMVRERMKDSVVPLFKEIESHDAPAPAEATSADEIDFPWIDPHGGTRGLKPESDADESSSAEKKTSDEAQSRSEVDVPASDDAAEDEVSDAASAPSAPAMNTPQQAAVSEAGSSPEPAAEPQPSPEPVRQPDQKTADEQPVAAPPATDAQPSAPAAEMSELEALEASFTRTLQLDAYQQKNDRRMLWAAAAVACVIAVIVAVFYINAGDDEAELEARQAMQDRLDRQQQLSDKLESELADMRQRQALEQQSLREQTEALQRERDEAIARAEQEAALSATREQQVDEIKNQIKQTETRIKKEASKAVEREKEKQKAIASKTTELENKLEEQRKRLFYMINELENTQRQAELEAEKSAVVEASDKPVAADARELAQQDIEMDKQAEEDARFAADPCSGPQARFVSNCR